MFNWVNLRRVGLLLGLVLFLTACSVQGTETLPASSPTSVELDQPDSTPTEVPESGISSKQYDAPPAMQIDPGKIYLATLVTELGEIKIELFADKAPNTVNNFVFLSREGYYDETTFHRVIPDFMAQGGDPSGTGAGGPGYQFEDEFHPDLFFDRAGVLAMANAGPNTNGSQFFITYVPTPHLNNRHTIFGQVVEGLEIALALNPRNPQLAPSQAGDQLLTVEIEEIGESLLPTPTPTPEPLSPEPAEGRPLAELEIPERENIYNTPPEMEIDPNTKYTAKVQTTQGELVIELDAQNAPKSVNNFVVLAELGYWDGFPVNHVEPEQFLVVGSPASRPDSDVGYVIPSEVGLSNTPGAVGFYFRTDINAVSGGQLYITLGDLTQLDSFLPAIGYVVEGEEVLEKLSTEDVVERIDIEKQD
jgi:cyclophilin family peptidyl-prolyl cis-trans isomerase